MRYLTMILMCALFALPAMAQDAPKEPAKDTPEAKEVKKPEMTAEGKKILADFKLIYSKYYATLLSRIKDGQEYDSNEVWDEAVKEAKNATYKDRTEFFTAVKKMKKQDRLFKKASSDLINQYAKDHAAAVKKINKDE